MPYRKVGSMERLWCILRSIFHRQKYVYDFHLLTEYDDLKSILHALNTNGFHLVCFTHYEGDLAVIFRRPADG